MTRWLTAFRDPMIALLIIATVLAIVLPATGRAGAAAQQVANAGIFLLFLTNGMRVAFAEVLGAFRNLRYFAPLTLWVFGVMAALGLGFQWIAALMLPSAVALGFLFIGILPSTIQSATTYTTLAGGSIVLAVVGAALTNIMGVFLSAPLFALLGGAAGAADTETLLRILQILILPFVLGQLSRRWTAAFIARHAAKTKWLDRLVIAGAVYVAFSGAVEQGIGDLGPVGWSALIGLVTIFLALAHGGSWLASGLLRLDRAERIAFLFAGGQKTISVGAALAAVMFPPAIAGYVIAPLLFYHLFQLVIAAPLSSMLADEAPASATVA